MSSLIVIITQINIFIDWAMLHLVDLYSRNMQKYEKNEISPNLNGNDVLLILSHNIQSVENAFQAALEKRARGRRPLIKPEKLLNEEKISKSSVRIWKTEIIHVLFIPAPTYLILVVSMFCYYYYHYNYCLIILQFPCLVVCFFYTIALFIIIYIFFCNFLVRL